MLPDGVGHCREPRWPPALTEAIFFYWLLAIGYWLFPTGYLLLPVFGGSSDLQATEYRVPHALSSRAEHVWGPMIASRDHGVSVAEGPASVLRKLRTKKLPEGAQDVSPGQAERSPGKAPIKKDCKPRRRDRTHTTPSRTHPTPYWLPAIPYSLLAIGHSLLAIGYLLLATYYWLLAIGCWLLLPRSPDRGQPKQAP
jgi:hypothetical protein